MRHHCLSHCQLVVAPAGKVLPMMVRHCCPPRRQLDIMPVSKGLPTMPRHQLLLCHHLVIARASKKTANNIAPFPLLSCAPPPLPLPSVCAAAIAAIRERARDGRLSQGMAISPAATAIAQQCRCTFVCLPTTAAARASEGSRCLHHHHCPCHQSMPPPFLPSLSKRGTASCAEAPSSLSAPHRHYHMSEQGNGQ